MPLVHQHPNYHCHKCLNFCRQWFGARRLAVALGVIFGVGFFVSAAFLAVLEFCDDASQSVPTPIKPAIAWVHANQFPIAMWLLMIQGATGAAAWLLRKVDEWATPELDKLQRVLDRLVEGQFENRVPEHVYRATLFREHGCWGLGKWLGIVARSGQTYARSNTIFCVSLKKRGHNTGIAGECWRRANSMTGSEFFTELPDCRNDEHADAIALYNRMGQLSQLEFHQIQVRSCVFRAVAIRRRGKVWGVLVIDCTDRGEVPDTTNKSTKAKEEYRRKRERLVYAAETISLLLD